jgi:hypothetical protein
MCRDWSDVGVLETMSGMGNGKYQMHSYAKHKVGESKVMIKKRNQNYGKGGRSFG